MEKLHFKKAYTLAEVVITMVVLAIIISVTMKITTTKIKRVDKYNYYAAYTLLSDIASELVFESSTSALPDNICSEFTDRINLYNKTLKIQGVERTPSCSYSHSITTVTEFDKLVPNLVTGNGMRFFHLNALPTVIPQLNGEEGNNLNGFTIYVDLNGERGNGELYNDVYPFYLTLSGKVIPAYPVGSTAGGNSKSTMLFSVRYDELTNEAGIDKRNEIWLVKSVSFQEAACKSGYVKSPTYCIGFAIDANCSAPSSDCILVPLKPIKYMVR